MRKHLTSVCLAILLPVILPSVLFAATITDISGRKVVLPQRTERIIAIKGALSILCYLDAASGIVGVEIEELPSTKWIGARGRTYSMANPHLRRLPVIGNRSKPVPEKIISLKPQLIFTGGEAQAADQLQRQTGIPVVVLATGDLGHEKSEFYNSLRLAASVMGRQKRADDVINRIEKDLLELKTRTATIPVSARKKVYIGGLQFRVGHGILGTSREYLPFRAVNAINVVDALPVSQTLVKGRFSIDAETFLTLKPDVLFVSEIGKDIVMKELKEPLYSNLNAVRNGQVYGLLPHFYSADPATVLAEGWYVGKVLYPEKFRDIDISQKADELYRFFNGRPLYGELERIFGGFRPLLDSK